MQFSRDPELAGRVIFVEDYGIQVARELVRGVDIWLNTPRRGEEACGTSGMKAGINGALNMSILDGWFDEADEAAGGWAIGDREPYSPDRDDAHAAGIYSSLENEIVPMYYDREQGVPEEWMRRVKQSLRLVSANFNCQRMVDEYRSQLYEPAHRAFEIISDGRFQAARERVRWSRTVVEKWPRVRFIDCGIDAETVSTGLPVALRAEVDLAGLKAGRRARRGGGRQGGPRGRVGGNPGADARSANTRGTTWNRVLCLGGILCPLPPDGSGIRCGSLPIIVTIR